ncbi:hypothetical protein PCC7418_0183 [Halothece sp. PCC 7418]|uniref:hypothetical protein n=1 Tax=Halothece sp. (strain PCC 7418) TaxID=65093 RepID=UPI0002A05D86|nr:hypothetical protein [Halothece sp. PCC 7418]AFZ42421.1 hypothetical protein PCC7418_0183 [Halothece sp. PCC 7418]
MRTTNHLPSVCRYCRHYSPQGRRGGMCQKLSAPVRGDWQACSLANAPFLPTWETWEEITILKTHHFQVAQPIVAQNTESEVEVAVEAQEEEVKPAALRA